MKFLKYTLFAAIIMAGLGASQATHAYASTPPIDAGYNNRIIDDPIFLNSGSMSTADIQNFLNTKVPSCDSGHTGGDPNQPPPYICLRNYTDPTTGKSAAQVIHDEAVSVGINPQVILVTLQKEQSLVTDSWPYPSQYKTAMGYGCRESQTVCDSAYYGFYNQVHLGASLLRAGEARNCGDTSTLPNWYIDPQWARGASPLVDGVATYLSNCATGSFYNYTPHRPDSAYTQRGGTYYYGNYNFVNFFTSWFGSPWLPSYAWQLVGQSSSKDLTSLPVGQKTTLTVQAKNTGSATWTNSGANPTRLGASRPNDRLSAFSLPSWVASTRPARLTETSVAPGATGTFTFEIQAPNAPGTYLEYFNLIDEGITWMNDLGMNFNVRVVPASLSASVTTNSLPSTVTTASATAITQSFTNTGNVTWYQDGKYPIHMGANSPNDRSSPFFDASWLGATRPSALNEAKVEPGQTGSFTFKLNGPHAPGSYAESFGPVMEGVAWFGASIAKTIAVQGTYQAAAAAGPSVNLVAGQSQSVTLSFTNSGTATWSNNGTNPVKLGTSGPRDRTSPFCDPSWPSCSRPAVLNEASVAPGATGTFTFTVASKSGQSGTYNERYAPVAESQEWFSTPDANLAINVTPARLGYGIASQQAYADSGKSLAVDLTQLSAGQTAWLVLAANNTGNTSWSNAGANPIDLGTWTSQDRQSRYATPAWLGPNRPARLREATVAPGQPGTFEFPITVPAGGGTFDEHFDLVSEGVSWFPDTGLNYHSIVNAKYAWALTGQYAFANSTKATSTDLTNLAPGQTAFIGLTAKNTGTATWYAGGPYPARLGTTNPRDRSSAFATTGWLGQNRPAALKETSVAPGQTGTFEFNYTAPSAKGIYVEYFNPMVESLLWMNELGMNFYTVVR